MNSEAYAACSSFPKSAFLTSASSLDQTLSSGVASSPVKAQLFIYLSIYLFLLQVNGLSLSQF